METEKNRKPEADIFLEDEGELLGFIDRHQDLKNKITAKIMTLNASNEASNRSHAFAKISEALKENTEIWGNTNITKQRIGEIIDALFEKKNIEDMTEEEGLKRIKKLFKEKMGKDDMVFVQGFDKKNRKLTIQLNGSNNEDKIADYVAHINEILRTSELGEIIDSYDVIH